MLGKLVVGAAGLGLVAVAILPWLGGGGTPPLAPTADDLAGVPAEDTGDRPAARRPDGGGAERVPAQPVALRGRVVDGAGAPVAGVEVSLRSLDVLPGQEPPPRLAVSGAGGTIEFTGPIVARNHRVGVVSPSWAMVGDGRFARDARDPGRELTVVVRRLTPLGGVVVDADGALVPGVRLRARSEGRAWAEGETDAAGRFTLWAARASGQPAEVQVHDPGPHQAVELDGVLRWGQRDATIRLPRSLQVVVRAVEADTGRPVEEFAIRSRPARRRAEDAAEPRLRGRHPAGEVVVDGLWAGVNYLQVVPSDPMLEPSELESVEASAGALPSAPIVVTLARRRAVRVVFRTADGQPVAGVLCELIDPRGRTISASTHCVDPAELALSKALWRRKLPRLCASAETGGDGAAMLRVPVDGRDVVLRATRANMDAVLRAIPALARIGDELEVRIPAWARLRGTVRPAPPAAWRARLSLKRLDKRGVTRSVELDEDGRFDVDELQAATWRLALEVPVHQSPDGSGPTRALGSLGDVVLAGGDARGIELDGSRFRPARLRGQVLLDGAPAQGFAFLCDSGRRAGPFPLDAGGRFDSGPQIAANATLLLRSPAGPERWVEYLHGKAIVLHWGEAQERSFHFMPHTLRLRLRYADGTPAERMKVRFSVRVWTEPRNVWTDRDGIAELDHAPYGHVFVSARASNGRDQTIGELDLSADEPLREVEFVLDEPRE